MNNITKPPLLKLLMIITDWEKTDEIGEVLKHHHVHMYYKVAAMGTANSEMLDLFGLESIDKAITYCLAPEHMIESLLHEMSVSFSLKKRGKGIAFTLPICSAGASILSLLSDELKQKVISYMSKIESEVEKMKEESSYNLIISIINQGYSEELMEAAKEAGATGGTVVHARGLGAEESLKHLGFNILPEKEMVYILTPHDKKVDIMKAINQACGLKTEAQGILFALPVDSVAMGREA